MGEMKQRSVVVELHHAICCCGWENRNCALLHCNTVWSGSCCRRSRRTEWNDVCLNCTSLPTSNAVRKGRSTTAMLQLVHFVTLCDPACATVATPSSCTEPQRPASRYTLSLSRPSCYTQKNKKHNFILGYWPHPYNNRQKFCVYLTLSTSSVLG